MMVRLVAGLFLTLVPTIVFGSSSPPVSETVDLRFVELNKVVKLYFMEVNKRPYILCSDVLGDDRMVSLRGSGKTLTGPLFASLLDEYGYEARERGGVTVVCKKKNGEAEPETDGEPFFYRVKHRDSVYLVDLVSPMVKGTFANKRSSGGALSVGGAKVQPSGLGPTQQQGGAVSGNSFQSSGDDYILFAGTAKEIGRLKALLAQVDTPIGEVVIKAMVVEVTTGASDGTAFSLVANVLGGRLGVSVGSSSSLANSVTVRAANIEAAFSVLAADSRFKAVSTPRIRVQSGQQARLVVGQDVPTLGAVTIPQGGAQAVQSIEYRSSGVILGLSPIVRDEGVELLVDQQISDFARTETGVNNSPTLTKRSLSTTVNAADGELIVLGGLTQEKNSSSSTGLPFLPSFMRSDSRNDTRTELLLLLQVERVAK